MGRGSKNRSLGIYLNKFAPRKQITSEGKNYLQKRGGGGEIEKIYGPEYSIGHLIVGLL